MKAGTYYVGDPCYVFDKSWGKFLDEYNKTNKPIQTILGHELCIGQTAYGDGEYYDENSKMEFTVDAGLLACLPVEMLEIDKRYTVEDVSKSTYMHIVIFEEDFEADTTSGVFQFGPIKINTYYDFYDEEYEDEDDEDY